MRRGFTIAFCLGMVLLFGVPSAWAVRVGSFCFSGSTELTKELKKEKVFKPVFENSLFPVGSLVKVFTTFSAAKIWGLMHQFETQVQIYKYSQDEVSLFIESSNDPFLGITTLKNVFYQLQNQGVQKIRDVFYSSKLHFLPYPRSWAHAAINPGLDVQFAQILEFQKQYKKGDPLARQMVAPLSQNLGALHIQWDKLTRVDNSEVKLNFHEQMILKSPPLYLVLKEMNRSSHNVVAERIFSSLGGLKVVRSLLRDHLGLTARDVILVNGSGLPSYLFKQRLDSRSSCRAILSAFDAIETEVERQLGLENGLEEIFPVAGEELEGEYPSTVTRHYKGVDTNQVLVAKTGTIDPSVSLGGQVSTALGPLFFGVVVLKKKAGGKDQLFSRSGTNNESARKLIYDLLSTILGKLKKGEPYPRRYEPYYAVREIVWPQNFAWQIP